MAQIIKTLDNTYGLKLFLHYDFIAKNNLYSFVNNSIYNQYAFSGNTPGGFEFSINLPFNLSGGEDSFKQFLTSFEQIFKEYNITKPHIDHLLFLSQYGAKINMDIQREKSDDKGLRTRGKLLYDLIKVPFLKYKIENIYDAFEDQNLLKEEINDYLILYTIVEDNPNSNYLNQNKEDFDLTSLNENQLNKLVRRINAENNISVKMENGNYLIVSKNIQLRFSPSIKVKDINQNVYLNTIIINDLFNEQKDNETPFYFALLKHDFITNNQIDILSKAVGLWNFKESIKRKRIQFYDFINNYLSKEELLKRSSDTDTKRVRNNFIYQYFLLLDVISEPGSDETHRLTVDILNDRLQNFLINKRKHSNYSTKRFHQLFK